MAIDPDKPMVALTFERWPKAGDYRSNLDILVNTTRGQRSLSSAGGSVTRRSRKILRRAAAQGSEIAKPYWSHNFTAGKNYVGVRYEIKNTNQQFSISLARIALLPPAGARTTTRQCA
jgi:hypothetical protein